MQPYASSGCRWAGSHEWRMPSPVLGAVRLRCLASRRRGSPSRRRLGATVAAAPSLCFHRINECVAR
ncbi:hypothetical protein MRX96_050604 [Rhipicephalus microplus]